MACNETNINIKESAPSSGDACQLSIQLLPYALKTPVILGTVEHWTGFNNGNPALSRPIVIGEHHAVTGATYTAALKTHSNPFIAQSPTASGYSTLTDIATTFALNPVSDTGIESNCNLAVALSLCTDVYTGKSSESVLVQPKYLYTQSYTGAYKESILTTTPPTLLNADPFHTGSAYDAVVSVSAAINLQASFNNGKESSAAIESYPGFIQQNNNGSALDAQLNTLIALTPFANNGVSLSNIISVSLGLTPSCEIGSYSASDIKIPDPINLVVEHTKSKANDAYLNTRFGCGSLKPIKIEHGHSLSINKNNTVITVWRECYEKRLCVTLGISSPLLNMRDKPANHGHIAASQLTTCIKTGHEHFVRATLYEPIHNACAQSVTYSGANLYIDTGILQGQTNLCANVVKLNKGFDVSSDLSITYGLTIKHAGTHAAVVELTIDPKFKILMTAGLNSNTTFVPTNYPMIAHFETGSSASSVLSVIHANAAIGHASSTMLSFAPRVFDRCFSDINYISIEQLSGTMSETDIELTMFARPVVAPKIIVAEEGEIVRVEF